MKSRTSPAKGVFFDLYGTLLIYGDMESAWSVWFEILYAVFIKSNPKLSREELARQCEGFFSRPEPSATDNGLTVYERRLDGLARQLDQSLSPEDLSVAATASVEAWEEFITLDPDTLKILRTLTQKRVPTALITNFDHPPHIHRLLDRLDLRRFFDVITISAEVGIKKPDPRIFDDALRATGLKPENVIFIGDTDDDMRAAIACGMRPVLIRRSDSYDSATSDYRPRSGNQSEPDSLDPGITVIADLRALLSLVTGSD